MSGLLLCGKTAEKPLYIAETDQNIYSLEELCYYVYHNLYIISEEFFNSSLFSFIEDGLKLENMAKKLTEQRFHGESYIDMIKTVLDGSSYYGENEKEDIIRTLIELENKSSEQRIKARGDLLAEKGRYSGALKCYREIAEKKSVRADEKFTGTVLNNMGVIYGRMLRFEEATECFEKAYNMTLEREYKDNLICAAILLNDGKIKKDIANKYNIDDDVCEKYMQAMELAKKDIRQDANVMELERRMTYSEDRELSEYYIDTGRIIENWKEEYREQMQ